MNYVYWFKIRQVGTYSPGKRQGFYSSRIYFDKLSDAQKHRESHKIEMYIAKTGITTTTYPRMYRILKKNVPKNIHINGGESK